LKKFEKISLVILITLLVLGGSPLTANAATLVISAGDTSFVLLSAALVLLMTPGMDLFYGGMVRRKDVLSIMMQCFRVLAVASGQLVLFVER